MDQKSSFFLDKEDRQLSRVPVRTLQVLKITWQLEIKSRKWVTVPATLPNEKNYIEMNIYGLCDSNTQTLGSSPELQAVCILLRFSLPIEQLWSIISKTKLAYVHWFYFVLIPYFPYCLFLACFLCLCCLLFLLRSWNG